MRYKPPKLIQIPDEPNWLWFSSEDWRSTITVKRHSNNTAEIVHFYNAWKCPHCYSGHSPWLIKQVIEEIEKAWPEITSVFVWVKTKTYKSPNPGFSFKCADFKHNKQKSAVNTHYLEYVYIDT